MTGLVLQLQAEAMNRTVPIMDLLRKAKAVAIKLRQNDIVSSLDNEMSGYPESEEAPEYRKLGARLHFLNSVRGWCPVVGGEHTLPFGGSVGEIARLVEGEGDQLISPASPNVVKELVQYRESENPTISPQHFDASFSCGTKRDSKCANFQRRITLKNQPIKNPYDFAGVHSFGEQEPKRDEFGLWRPSLGQQLL
jgi:hypothetical protein